jgi:hypothetical protein
MKKLRIGLVLMLCTLNYWQSALAQGTAFTYQGQLRANNASTSGNYDLTFTLFGTNTDGVAISGPLTNSAVNVSNGLFTVTLDFGNQFSGMPRWLEIGVRTNGGGAFTTLAPRQPLTPTPYAIMAGSASNFLGTLPATQLSGTYSNQVQFNNGANVFDGTFVGQFLGSTFTGGLFTGQFIGDGSGLTGLWRTAGNFGTTPGVNFVGTTDNQPLVFKVNGQEAMRYEPTAETPNIIGGWSGNYAQPGLSGVTIGGGGTLSGNQPNIAVNNAFNSTIAGGYHNMVANYGAAILGGSVNNASGYFATIGAGQFHTNFGDYAFIGSGQYNNIQDSSPYTFIGGGYQNIIGENNYSALIGAGNNNTIQSNAWGAIIGGGNQSTIQTFADHAIIANGWQNLIQTFSFESVIGGGAENNIGPSAIYAVIAGGNNITNLAGFTFVGGGYNNQITSNANMSSIGGGLYNTIRGDTKASSSYGEAPSSIGGGMQNTIHSNSAWSSISGGFLNQIQPFALVSAIGGGYQNIIQGSSNYWSNFNVYGATIGGGAANVIETNSGYSTIAGGLGSVIHSNSVASFIGGGANDTLGPNAGFSTIGGGQANTIMSGSIYSFIGGGDQNIIQTNDYHSVISGGAFNVINTDAHDSAIGGGYQNFIQAAAVNGVIGGGYTNVILPGASFSAIGGGLSNIIGNAASTIPGGYGNSAMGSNSFAAGTFAQATNDGSFVLTDQHYANFYSTADNQLSARFLGGIRFVTGGAGMTVDGLPLFAGTDGSTLNNVNAATLGGIASSGFWKTTGNAGTSPGANFIGTTDNQTLLIKGSFVGVGRANRIGNEFFGVDAPVPAGTFGGMYINTTNATGLPFYGYAQANGIAAYHYIDGGDTNKWKLVIAGGVRLTVANNGFVGIGTTVPDSPLTVNGNASKPGGGQWSVFSDVRLKKNIEPLTGALDRLLQLRSVTFEYKDPQSIHEAPGVQIGMIAQEVEKIFPDWVDTAANGMKRLSIHGFEALTVQALRELRAEKDARISALERHNAQIEKELAAERDSHRQLEARFSALEAAVARLSEKPAASDLSFSPPPATTQPQR